MTIFYLPLGVAPKELELELEPELELELELEARELES